MRLPVSKLYRAFPELDAFTDLQCHRLMLRARHRAGVTPGEGCAGVFLAYGAVAIIASLLSERVISQFVKLRDDMTPAAIFIGIVVLGMYAALRTRDRMTKKILRHQLRRTTCPSCKASLLGARRSADSAQCRECSTTHRFVALNIQIEDLGPPLIVLDADTKCGACGYAIAGLPIHRGEVMCPECGERTAVVQEGAPVESTDSIGAEERKLPGFACDKCAS